MRERKRERERERERAVPCGLGLLFVEPFSIKHDIIEISQWGMEVIWSAPPALLLHTKGLTAVMQDILRESPVMANLRGNGVTLKPLKNTITTLKPDASPSLLRAGQS